MEDDSFVIGVERPLEDEDNNNPRWAVIKAACSSLFIDQYRDEFWSYIND